MKTKPTLLSFLALLVGAFSFAGCAASSGVDATMQSVSVAALPEVPGCDQAELASGQLTTLAVAGVNDLYLVYSNGTPLCADSREDLETLHVRFGGLVESNPMPGYGSSNPMPGEPGDPAESNPMPGRPTGCSASSTTGQGEAETQTR